MTTTRRAVLTGGSLLTSAALLRTIAIAQPIEAGGAPEPISGLLETAIEAYIYGYPLVTMELTRRAMTNVEKPAGSHAPMGQFANLREYPTATFRDVTAPNADTLYSAAWLDLSQGPWILQVPDEHGRYYLMPMLEAWTDVFADPGTRTTGTGADQFAIVGPDLTVNSHRVSNGFSQAQIWCGSSGAPTALARRRITLRYMPSRISTSSCRSVPMVSRTHRPLEWSILQST
jgi:hypothetical protein